MAKETTSSDPLIQAWQTHARINHYLLDAIHADVLNTPLAAKHRSPFQLLAHMHNVRLMWLKAADPEGLATQEKIEAKEGDAKLLREHLDASAEAISALIAKAQAAGGRVRNFKPDVTGFVAYLISHESHHRGQIGWTLKNSKHPLDQKVMYGLWAWGVR